MEKSSPQFSICIPTIGRYDLIKTALESLTRQTCQDFEVIIGDSHRNRDIVRLVEEMKDARIRVVHPPKDAGAFSPWDYPPRFARGAYIMWLDDDNCLLPFALKLFADAIFHTHADVITASHLYYYDNTHPQPHMRRSLGIVPFTGGEYSIDLKDALRRLFSFSLLSPGTGHPRFHFSATIFSRNIINRAYERLGHVLFPDLPHMYSLSPILFSFARTCHFVDFPVAVIGRLGVSMGQTWSTSARKRFEHRPIKGGLSPLTAYTKVNGIFENYLRVRHELPEYFKDLPIDKERFAEAHLRELFLLDTPLCTGIQNWHEFFVFLRQIKEPERTALTRKGIVYATLAPLVFLARRLRIHYIRRIVASVFTAAKERRRPSEQLWDREFTVPFPRGAGYDSITEVTARAREIVHAKTGRDILWHSLPH